MRELNLLKLCLLATLVGLPAAAYAGDEAADDTAAEPAPGSKEAAQNKKDDAKPAPAAGSKEAAPAAGSKEAADAKKAADAAAAAATAAAAEGAEAVEEAVEPAAEAVEEVPAEVVQEVVEEPPGIELTAEEKAQKPVVTLSTELGAVWQHGNTKAINVTGGLAFGVKKDRNKFGLTFGGAYGRGVVPDSGSDEWVEIAKNIGGALRYDRYIIPDVNSIYVGGGALHDPLAGFLIQARGDVGYSHQLVKTEKHSLLAEGGFNYSRDQFMPIAEGGAGGGQNFVGGRIAGLYGLNINGNFGFTQQVEALLGGRNNQDAGEEGFDGKITSATGISGSLNKILSVKFGFKLTYDFVPPVRADGTSYEALDTLTSFTLVATLM